MLDMGTQILPPNASFRSPEEQRTRLGLDSNSPEPPLHWMFLLLGLVALAGILGNVLVCLAICLERRLHNVTNYFLLSLAVADLLVCLAVMPFAILDGLYGSWQFGAGVCNVWVTCDVLACSSSILHMCWISVGRYVGIRNPLGARQGGSGAVAARVALVWLAAGAITSPITVMAALDPSNVQPAPDTCAINNRFFFVFGSLCAFYLPMVVMVVAYVLTVRLLSRKAKFLADKASPRRIIFIRRQRDDGKTVKRAFRSCHPGSRYFVGGSRTSQVMTEQRATKVLGVVFFSFILCWAPFFVLNVLFAAEGPEHFPTYLETTFLWLGYLSSTINPLIYTIFNRTFKRAFWRILRCRWRPPSAARHATWTFKSIPHHNGKPAADC
ncbi:hypothetical protein LAZ67_18002281 [Cordylochernes scorpioides]|uniref:G-protein coupled receptors family 1 profile domain-containing protein n=1 Tax=Cordylochernes scorpioides TaxID=51811 RepID=A0ABY6LJ20_9ARAC|nr:hypothetical protein LAZ67_18002281 [Cordylochernes scorpioides]